MHWWWDSNSYNNNQDEKLNLSWCCNDCLGNDNWSSLVRSNQVLGLMAGEENQGTLGETQAAEKTNNQQSQP